MFSALLKSWNVSVIGAKHHDLPVNVKISEPYEIYGFFRNPLDRFLSLLKFMKNQIHKWGNFRLAIGLSENQIRALSYDELLDAFPKYETLMDVYFLPQSEWLKAANLLDFNNYTQEILRVAKMLGQTQVLVGKLNESTPSDEVPSQRVIDFVQSYYADDYRLWQERAK